MKLKSMALSVAAVATATSFTVPVQAQSDVSYLGGIFLVGFSWCPRGSIEAAGQLMSIQANTALFSLIGTTYGGDGTVKFALPDLRGRLPLLGMKYCINLEGVFPSRN